MTYYHTATSETREFDDSWFAEMSAAQNPKVAGWLAQPPAPTHSNAQHAPEWADGQWTVRDKTTEELAADSAKTWPSKAEFWNEFSDVEKLAILDSTIPQIRMLDKALTMWSGSIVSTDSRITGGMSALVTVGILTAERKTAMLT